VAGIPPEGRGRAFGFHRTADTLGAVVGPLLGLLGYELLNHRIRPLLAQGMEVYCYFKHEEKPEAPRYAERLLELLA